MKKMKQIFDLIRKKGNYIAREDWNRIFPNGFMFTKTEQYFNEWLDEYDLEMYRPKGLDNFFFKPKGKQRILHWEDLIKCFPEWYTSCYPPSKKDVLYTKGTDFIDYSVFSDFDFWVDQRFGKDFRNEFYLEYDNIEKKNKLKEKQEN